MCSFHSAKLFRLLFKEFMNFFVSILPILSPVWSSVGFKIPICNRILWKQSENSIQQQKHYHGNQIPQGKQICWGRTRQKRVCVWWGQHALIAIKVDLSGECPSLLEGKCVLVLLKKNLWLNISQWPSFHQQVIVEFHAVKHSGVICMNK